MGRPTGWVKIILSVIPNGNLRLRVPIWRSWGLVDARVLPGQHCDLQGRDTAVRNGKEKVYGSIP